MGDKYDEAEAVAFEVSIPGTLAALRTENANLRAENASLRARSERYEKALERLREEAAALLDECDSRVEYFKAAAPLRTALTEQETSSDE